MRFSLLFPARRLLLCCFLALMSAPLVAAAEIKLLIVSSERSAAYQEASSALLNEIKTGSQSVSGSQVEQVVVSEWDGSDTLRPRLIVALGTQACSVMAKKKNQIPLLCALLPRTSFESVMRESVRSPSDLFSAIYLNHPFTRQLDLLQLAMPKVRRVGVLWGPESRLRDGEKNLARAIHARGLQLVSVQVEQSEPVFKSLKQLVEKVDVVLAIPEPQIYNSGNIQNIMLTTFRARVPMLAFSPAYVRAGALLSLYSTPGQIGQQAGVMANEALQGRGLDVPQYPSDFVVGVNDQVAYSLGLSLDATHLSQQLKLLPRREKSP